ncbi:hypothetical protein HN873_008823, partial [Arachis hypogaea]
AISIVNNACWAIGELAVKVWTQQVTHRGNKEGREELLVVLLSHIQILRVTMRRVNKVSRSEIRGGIEAILCLSLSVSLMNSQIVKRGQGIEE